MQKLEEVGSSVKAGSKHEIQYCYLPGETGSLIALRQKCNKKRGKEKKNIQMYVSGVGFILLAKYQGMLFTAENKIFI